VVVGTGHEIIKHDRRGEMIKRLSLNSVKPALPDGTMKMDRFNRLYIRAYEKAYYENAVVVLDSSWKVIKEFPRSFVRDKTRGISMIMPIFRDDKYVYYKESMSDTLYGIDAKLERVPVAILDFGAEAAGHDSFDTAAKSRKVNDLHAFYAFNSLWYFSARGSFVFLKRSRRLIHVKLFQLTLHGVQWTPVGSAGNEWFLRAEAVDLLDHLDDITDPALHAIVERLDEADNPVLAVLEMK
jgi:hypothetical protein